jgi:hypothetical protein
MDLRNLRRSLRVIHKILAVRRPVFDVCLCALSSPTTARPKPDPSAGI